MQGQTRETGKVTNEFSGQIVGQNSPPSPTLSSFILNETPVCPFKLRSAKDLEALRNAIMFREKPRAVSIAISVSTCSIARGAAKVADALQEELHKRGLNDSVGLRRTGCRGFCDIEPVVVVYPHGVTYRQVSLEDVQEIVSESVINGKVVDRLLYRDPSTGQECVREEEMPFYRKQRRVLLKSHTDLDPQSIENYVAAGGYSAISRVIHEMHPDEICDRMYRASRCVRGMEASSACQAGMRSRSVDHIICDSREVDPGGRVQPSLLEGNPHRVIEGMMIGAFALGAASGHVYLRRRSSLAAENLAIALAQARDYGILGKNVLGSRFDFDITFSSGNGLVPCAESGFIPTKQVLQGFETPPQGQQKIDVVVENVETWAKLPIVISEDWRWHPNSGAPNGRDTKIFSLVGAVRNSGMLELALGASLREIVFDVGGGMRNGKALKAVHIGGPWGSFIPTAHMDVELDMNVLASLGISPRASTIAVLDQSNCIVDMTHYFIKFLGDELCGKCSGCHPGLGELADILGRLVTARGRRTDIARIRQLAKAIKEGSQCETGSNAANTVLSSLRYFLDEYRAHVHDGRCPAGMCKSLVTLAIDPEKCRGCRECAVECPENAIAGKRGEPQSIDSRLCIKCRICQEVCEYGAILIR